MKFEKISEYVDEEGDKYFHFRNKSGEDIFKFISLNYLIVEQEGCYEDLDTFRKYVQKIPDLFHVDNKKEAGGYSNRTEITWLSGELFDI